MMSIIRGRNGRIYKDGKLVDPVVHPELRSRDELIAARAANQPRREHQYGLPDHGDGNPIRRAMLEHGRIKGVAWQRSPEGRKWMLEKEAEAAEWDQQRAAAIAEQQRQESVRPLREHAEKQVQAVFDDPAYSVEEVEQAEAALAAARAGDRDAYVAWERQHHEKLLNKLAEEAAAADSVARQAAERRNAILQSGLNFKPPVVPEVKPPEPVPAIPVDSRYVSVTNDKGQSRIVRRDELNIAE